VRSLDECRGPTKWLQLDDEEIIRIPDNMALLSQVRLLTLHAAILTESLRLHRPFLVGRDPAHAFSRETCLKSARVCLFEFLLGV
jgi:hypothetical protein